MHMIIVNRIGDNISGTVNMKTFGVKYTKELYDSMIALKTQADDAVSMAELEDIVAKFELLTKQDYKGVVQTACPDLYVNAGKGTFHLKFENGKTSKQAIPQPLVDRILKSVELGIDTTPLIKFCIRIMRPIKGRAKLTDERFKRIAKYINYTHVDGVLRDELIKNEGVTPEVATERATVYQTPITMEGLLCTYKVSNELLEKFTLDDNGNKKAVPRYKKSIDEDTGEVTAGIPEHVEDRVFYPAVKGLEGGDPFFCEDISDGKGKLGHLIRVGYTHRLDNWNQVDQRDDASCVKGLHVGNLDYIRGYESRDTVTHNVFIDPAHIGAVTDDGSGALRVIQYFVHSSLAGKNRGIYHSSHYAALTDVQWNAMKEEIYNDMLAAKALVDEDQAELDGINGQKA